jgi:hypothetical protein
MCIQGLVYFSPLPPCLGYFRDRVLHLCLHLWYGLQSSYLYFPCSWDNRLRPPCPAIGWDEVSWTFCLDWPQTVVLPVSTSQVGRFTGLSYHAQPWWTFRLW